MKTSVKSLMIHPIIVPVDNSLRSYSFYLLQHHDACFLIDAGENTQACWDYFIQALKENRLEITDLDGIILTHNHTDHIGLVNRIHAVHPVPVFAHPDASIRLQRDETFLKERIEFFENIYLQMGCGLQGEKEMERLKDAILQNESKKINGEITPLEEGDSIFGLEVIYVLGHAPDHIALFHKETGTLFAGDHIIGHMPSNALIELGKDGERTKSLVMYEQALKKVDQLSMNKIYSGHGEVILNPHEVIKDKLARINEKAARIIKLMDTPQTVAELAKKRYKDRYESLFPLVMSEMIGHIDRLEHLGEVVKENQGDVYYYVRKKETGGLA